MTDEDIERRHAHTVGSGPRIEPLAEAEMDEAAIALIVKIRDTVDAAPMTVIPEYMRTVAHQPDIFRCQMEMGTALFKGRIPARERELAVLRVGWLTRAPYEWGQHVNIANRYEMFTAEELERITHGSSAAGWTDHEATILRGVEELLGDYALSDATWAKLAEQWDEAQLVEFPMMVGQYVATAFVQNTLRIRLEYNNAGLRQR